VAWQQTAGDVPYAELFQQIGVDVPEQRVAIVPGGACRFRALSTRLGFFG